MNDIAAIDILLAEGKSLAGSPRWIADDRGSVASLAVPVAVRGVIGGLIYRATALVHEPIQSGSCVLVLDGRPIQRLSFRPTHAHVNPFGEKVSARLRFAAPGWKKPRPSVDREPIMAETEGRQRRGR